VADFDHDPKAPIWTTLAQVVARVTDFVYDVQTSVAPPKLLRRHIMHLRFFDDALYKAPAEILDYAAFYRDAEIPVEEYLDIRRNGRFLEINVRWVGHPAEPDTWEPINVLLKDMPTFTRDWIRSLKTDPTFQTNPYRILLKDVFNTYKQLREPGGAL